MRLIYQFLRANQARLKFSITVMAQVFGINRRAYYAWRQRQPQRDRNVGREERAHSRYISNYPARKSINR